MHTPPTFQETRLRLARARTAALAAILFFGSAAQAAGLGMLAMLEGQARLIRGELRYHAEEGLPLSKEDILETGPDAGLLRIELQDGTMFDLGPSTRVMLAPPLPSSRSKLPAQLYLLQGWVKWTVGKSAGTLVSAPMDLQGGGRAVVAAVTRTGTVLAFAESGEWSVLERRDGGKSGVTSTVTLPLKQEELYTREGPAKGQVLERASAEFVKKMPRPFADSLPSRMKDLAPVAPRKAGEITYADVQPWIDAEPALRKQFVTRWRAKASEPEFRKGLQAGMPAHPEWDRIVNPEKYLPKPQPQLVLP